jgi:hypothetical protein
VGQVHNIVQRIVIGNNSRFGILQSPGINDNFLSILASKNGFDSSSAHISPSCLVLTTNCMTLKKHGFLETKQAFKTLDMNGIPTDCNTVPAPAHCAVGAAPCLLETHLNSLHFGGRNRGFLTNQD